MRLRLVLSFVLIVLVTMVSTVVVARQGAVNEVRAFMVRGSVTGLSEQADQLEAYYQEHGSWEGVQEVLPQHGRSQGSGGGQGRGFGQGQGQGLGAGVTRLRVADTRRVVVADSRGTDYGVQLSSTELANAVALKNGWITVGYLLLDGGVNLGQSEERFLVSRLNISVLTGGLIAAGVSLVLALILSYSLLRPVMELKNAASQLGGGDLKQRVPVRGNDELAEMARSFNRMADSLQQAQESRRAMTADIAHELRNPLAVQRANLEALQDGVYPLTVENLQPILEQNQLLTRLVDDLRTLALVDAGQLKLECAPTDLLNLLGRVRERFQPQAASRQVEIVLQPVIPVDTPPPLSLDAGRVEQILGNLLSNALRYTPEQGKVEICLSNQVQAVQVTIHDSGPGIPEEALPHIFERFYRADRSRSRSEGGTGLGLAIARQLAEVQGGTLRAANHPQGGAIFTLTLPKK